MGLVMPKNEGSSFTPPPAGTHIAICYRIIDCGTQEVVWQGNTKHQYKVLITWELPEELMEDGRPFTIGQMYTLSSHEKALLRQHLESWRGKAFTEEEFGTFDLTKLLGVPCLLGIVHNHKDGNTYANISSISKLHKGMQAPSPINPQIHFSLDKPDWDVFESLSEGLQNKIKQSPEYAKATGQSNGQAPQASDTPQPPSPDDYGVESDEIPF